MHLKAISRLSPSVAFAPDMHILACLCEPACDSSRVVAHAAALGQVLRRNDVDGGHCVREPVMRRGSAAPPAATGSARGPPGALPLRSPPRLPGDLPSTSAVREAHGVGQAQR